MKPTDEKCGSGNCGCGGGLSRRNFVKTLGWGAVGLAAARLPVMAGPFEAADFAKWIPADKKLHPDWVKSLFARGEPAVYRDRDLEWIGMPVGGLCAGQLYLGGDGRLWHWDIFNQHIGTGAGHYAQPPKPDFPLEQGFSLKIGDQVHALDATGFPEVSFRGQYPIGTVEYENPALPLRVTLDAFSPFVPLSTDDSSLPATVMQFTVRNTSGAAVEATLEGTLENAVCLHHRSAAGTRRIRVAAGEGCTVLECSAQKSNAPEAPVRPDVVFEDWNKDTYEGWTVEGTSFGRGPVRKSAIPGYQGDVGGDTERVANSHACAPGSDVNTRDAGKGKLTSRAFAIDRSFVNFWIGGGKFKGKTCLNLVVDGKVAQTATGRDENRMTLQTFDVRALKGKQAVIEIVDDQAGGWGNVGVGRITFSDRGGIAEAMEELPDFGTMGLALLGKAAEQSSGEASAPLAEKLVGSLGRVLKLDAGQSATVTFVLTWCFPNLEIKGLGKVGRHYATRFDSASAVAKYVAANFERLAAQTRLWRDTWYDSTLPHWFLDRTFLNASILATSTAYRFRSGRFWGWEGVGCCYGTCTHVWHYAHSVARLFPELERDLRERTDFGTAMDPKTGLIQHRGESAGMAVDGQAGCVLRAYREHQMSGDDAFLRRNWPKIRQALQCLIDRDVNADGILDGPQHNTLDAEWFGRVAWLSSLYVAALRAGEAMALETGDEAFARQARTLADAGGKNIDAQLFNGEYYLHIPDAEHVKNVGSHDGCEIDQVFGQSWAWQVGLGRILPEAHVKTALASLWKYNFAPDVGPYREAHKPGRWYAMAGEAGLLMCSWPKGEAARVAKGYDYYFNECMNGFEYQAAGHMVWENMLLEGFAVTRALHDRYHPSRRNPWNEVECGDHYARSMASYGVFLAACGFEYHGPKGHLGFAPRLTPDDFKALFTAAEGWGTYSQKLGAESRFEIALKHGKLRLRTLAFELPAGTAVKSATVAVAGQQSACKFTQEARRVTLTLDGAAVLEANQALVASLRG